MCVLLSTLVILWQEAKMADSMPGEVKHVVYEWNDAADIFSKLLLRAVGENLPTYSSENS